MENVRFAHAYRVVHDRHSFRPGMHRHQHHELLFIAKGHYHGRAEGRFLDLEPGGGLLCMAGIEHGCLDHCTGESCFSILQWDGPVRSENACTFKDLGNRIEHPLTRLLGIAEVPGPEAVALRDHLTAVIVQEALWLADPAKAPPPAEDPIDKVREHLDHAYCAPLDLDHLCTIADISRSTLTRRFRARYGTSPIRYLHDLRLRHARHLVEATALPMAEIAKRVGFQDPLHLGRQLKRASGKTVHELRRSTAG